MRRTATLAWKIHSSRVFDLEWYRLTSGRRFRTRWGAIWHYLRNDLAHGSPHPLFDPGYFNHRVREVNPAALPGLAGYLTQWRTRRDPSRYFREASWLAAHPEAQHHPGGPLGHFIANANGATLVPGTTLTLAELISQSRAAVAAWRESAHPAFDLAEPALVLITADYPAELPRMVAECEQLVIAYTGSDPTGWRELWLAVAGRCLRTAGAPAAAAQSVLRDLGLERAGFTTTAVEGLPAAFQALLPLATSGRVHAVVLHSDYTVHSAGGGDIAAGLPTKSAHGLHPDQLPEELPAPTPDWVAWAEPLAPTVPDRVTSAARVLPWQLSCAALDAPDTTEVAALRAALGGGRRRWAIEIAAPGRLSHRQWGDYHYAVALASALRELGEVAEVHFRGSRPRLGRRLADVNLVLRGLEPAAPVPGCINLLWVISHPDEVAAAELTGFDLAFAAASGWAAAKSESWGRPVRPLLQATSFTPTPTAATGRLVFVGNPRGVERPALTAAAVAGLEIDVYGSGWEGRLPANARLHGYAANDQLPAIYAGAAAVLCDHWPDMKQAGFIANRVFDVLAAGGLAIVDEVPGITELFPRGLRTYRSAAELVELGTSIDHWAPSAAERAELARQVVAKHSFRARAAELIAAVADIGR